MNKLLLIGLVAGVLFFMSNRKAEARGYRNNNPLNIKEMAGDKTQWVGERATDDDPVFEEFTETIYGLRAGAVILKNYMRLHGLYTIRGIISRWSATDQNAYIAYVAEKVGVHPDRPISEAYIPKLIDAMAVFENGYRVIDYATIVKATEMGGVFV